MKILQLTLLVLLGYTIISCDRDEDFSRFYQNQTKCSDPWNTGESESDEQTTVAITKFLKNKSINVLNVEFDNKSPLDKLCESCGCATGQRIIVYVEEDDESTMGNYQSEALERKSIKVYSGITPLVGPNGSGKLYYSIHQKTR